MERVFISGRGIVSPLGEGLPANEKALRSGTSGVTAVEDFISHRLDSQVGGMPNLAPDVSELVDR